MFVPGNADPDSYIENMKSEFILGMEKRGVKLLEFLYSIDKGKSQIHFANFNISIHEKNKLKFIELDSVPKDHNIHKEKLIDDISILKKDDMDLLIGLSHYPIVDNRIDYIATNPTYFLRDTDLILAAHYHGGQIRIPFIGALYIPEAWYDKGGLFPPQDRVKGLWEYRNIKQYVSTGLGSSDALPFLKFRFFNTPEINLLTLRSSK